MLQLAAVCLVLISAVTDDAVAAGWSRLELTATNSYAELYVPPTLDTSVPAPLVVYLHGAGAAPYMYRPFLEGAADALGAVMVLPKSHVWESWGNAGDRESVLEAVQQVRSLLRIDPARVAAAGHSAGAAFALRVALEGRGWCGVFAMASPYVSLGIRGDLLYLPPVRLYYGADDPNWFSGSGQRLVDLLEGRGLMVQLDLRQGYGHNIWPDEAMLAGLEFLLEHPRPVAVRAPDVAPR